jgi:hypothetical protein
MASDKTESIKIKKGTVVAIFKLLGPYVLAGSIGAGGAGLMTTQVAPDPVKVNEMSDTLIRIEASISRIVDGQLRDKIELQRQIDALFKLADKAEMTAVQRAEFEALKFRVARIEQERK